MQFTNSLRLMVLCVWLGSIAPLLRADEPAPAGSEAPTPGPDAKPETAPLDQQLKNDHAPFFVRAQMVGGTRNLFNGDQLFLQAVCEIDAFLYVFYQQADGQTFLIFPNKIQTDNRVKAGEPVRLPERDEQFRWLIGEPFGKESIKVVASKKRLENLSDPKLHEQFFNKIAGKQLKGAQIELAAESNADWADVDLTFEALPASARKAPGRRYGVFFGVSKYEFDRERAAMGQELKIGEDQGLNLNFAAADAQALADTFRRIGRLDDRKVFVDEQATKANLDQAIRWLAKVSRPGDTVFVQFSGHGTQLMDLSGDEADGLDEAICPYDSIDVLICLKLLDQLKKQPSEQLRQRLLPLMEIIKREGTDDLKKLNARLTEQTCVTDDEFAHWLQRLEGRQVVVLLDSCHSGGFAKDEKGAVHSVPPQRFDYLDGEWTRLKGMGSQDQALLSACYSKEVALEVAGHGLLTHVLLLTMKDAGPVRIEQAYNNCEALFPLFYEKVNKARAEKHLDSEPLQHASLMNLCHEPAILRP